MQSSNQEYKETQLFNRATLLWWQDWWTVRNFQLSYGTQGCQGCCRYSAECLVCCWLTSLVREGCWRHSPPPSESGWKWTFYSIHNMSCDRMAVIHYDTEHTVRSSNTELYVYCWQSACLSWECTVHVWVTHMRPISGMPEKTSRGMYVRLL